MIDSSELIARALEASGMSRTRPDLLPRAHHGEGPERHNREGYRVALRQPEAEFTRLVRAADAERLTAIDEDACRRRVQQGSTLARTLADLWAVPHADADLSAAPTTTRHLPRMVTGSKSNPSPRIPPSDRSIVSTASLREASLRGAGSVA